MNKQLFLSPVIALLVGFFGVAAYGEMTNTNNAANTPNAQDMQTLLEKANSGDAEAQFEVGKCYWNGNGVPKDQTEALKWFRKAAAQGRNAAAQDFLKKLSTPTNTNNVTNSVATSPTNAVKDIQPTP
jgi:TPR repeat protein